MCPYWKSVQRSCYVSECVLKGYSIPKCASILHFVHNYVPRVHVFLHARFKNQLQFHVHIIHSVMLGIVCLQRFSTN
jgi:hypothetical protein